MRANLVASLALLAQAAEGIVAIAASPIPTHDDNLPAQLHTPDTEIRRDLIPSPPTKRHGRCRNGNRRTMDGEPAGSTGSTAMPAPETPLKSSQGLRNVVYFTNWGIYGANYQPQSLPADQITHLLYAFAAVTADGSIHSIDTYADVEKHYPEDSWNDQGYNAYGVVKQLYLLKKKHRNLKTLLSIGGWTASQNGKFAGSVATDAQRQKFASSVVKLMGDWGMDGIDIDWEYPATASEAKDFVELLKVCRKALDNFALDNEQNYHYLMTVATAAGRQHYEKLEISAMDPYLDAWHLMAYDYAGSWDNTTGHQANLWPSQSNPESTKFNTNDAVLDYIKAGVVPDKIVLGLPLYGRSFANTEGLGKPYQGLGTGTIERGIWLYRDLPQPKAEVKVDKEAGAAWSYDEHTKELVTYDTPESATLKADYIKDKGLGGAVFWEASGDKTGGDSIVRTMAQALGAQPRGLASSENMLSYPASKYDNIKKGMM